MRRCFLLRDYFFEDSINDAIRVVRISATAVASNFKIMLWPFFSFFWIGSFSAVFCLIGVLLMASGDMVAEVWKKHSINFTDTMRYQQAWVNPNVKTANFALQR